MLTQLDIANSAFFEILYGVEPPDNTRHYGPGRDSEGLTDELALKIK
jgi:hypothetical protein